MDLDIICIKTSEILENGINNTMTVKIEVC